MNGHADGLGLTWFSGRARLVPCQVHVDERGILLPLEFDCLPFKPRRVFAVTGMPAGTERGGHAHRSGEQLLVCLQGRIEALLRREHQEVRSILLPSGPGLLLGPDVWCRQTYLDKDSILLVLASEPYDPTSYSDDWE